MPPGNPMEPFSQLRFLLPSYVLVLIELTKTNQHSLIGILPSIHPPYTRAALLTYKSGPKWAFLLTGQNLSSGLIPHLSMEQPPCWVGKWKREVHNCLDFWGREFRLKAVKRQPHGGWLFPLLTTSDWTLGECNVWITPGCSLAEKGQVPYAVDIKWQPWVTTEMVRSALQVHWSLYRAQSYTHDNLIDYEWCPGNHNPLVTFSATNSNLNLGQGQDIYQHRHGGPALWGTPKDSGEISSQELIFSFWDRVLHSLRWYRYICG